MNDLLIEDTATLRTICRILSVNGKDKNTSKAIERVKVKLYGKPKKRNYRSSKI